MPESVARAEDRELATIRMILEKNKEKNFVRRVLEPDKWPSIDLGDGWTGTHLMAWDKYGDRNIVFPTIVWDEKSKSLKNLGKGARDHALKTGEFIEFRSASEADWFSKRYKRVWRE